MLRLFKALPLTLALASLSIFATSCSTSNTRVRFVNAIADTQDYGNAGLDIEFNGTKEFTNIPFPNVSASTYTSVPAGNVKIEGLETNTTTVVFNNQTVSLSGGSEYTVVATGSAANGGSNVVLLTPIDTNTAPANGRVNFRVINASPNSGAAVDVYLLPNPNPCQPGSSGCTPTIAALSYQQTSSYVNLPFNSEGSSWQMIVTVAGNPNADYLNTTIGGFGSASEGAICTLVLTDQQNGSQMSAIPIALQDLNASGCTD